MSGLGVLVGLGFYLLHLTWLLSLSFAFDLVFIFVSAREATVDDLRTCRLAAQPERARTRKPPVQLPRQGPAQYTSVSLLFVTIQKIT